MKILQVVSCFYPAWKCGGPGKVVYDTSGYFASKGHETTIYTSDAYAIDERMPTNLHVRNIKNLKVRYFRNICNKLAHTHNFFVTPGIVLPSLKELKSFDIIHLHDFYIAQNVWIGFLANILKKPYFISVHGCLEEKRVAQRSFYKKMFLLLFGRKLLKKAARVIATSPNEVIAYKKFNIAESKVVKIAHGVDLNEFRTRLDKQQCRSSLYLPKEKIIVTYLGRIHKIKGLDMLVEAIRQISDKNIHFIIAGSNDGYLPILKKLIDEKKVKEKVSLLGTCFGEKKTRLFKASDIFVYPSYSEGFSLGILEAAASGLPLVITQGCHFSQVKDYKAGIITEQNSQSIAEGILALTKNESRRKQAGKNALALIKKCYSIEAIGNNLLNTYSKALIK